MPKSQTLSITKVGMSSSRTYNKSIGKFSPWQNSAFLLVRIFKPQRVNSDSDSSCNLPLFCTAMRNLVVVMGHVFQTFISNVITIGAKGEVTSNSANGSDANTCFFMNFAIRHLFFDSRHNLPAISHGLDFSGGAKILKEALHFFYGF